MILNLESDYNSEMSQAKEGTVLFYEVSLLVTGNILGALEKDKHLLYELAF